MYTFVTPGGTTGGSVRETPRTPVGPEYVDVLLEEELLVRELVELELEVEEVELEVSDEGLAVVCLRFESVWTKVTPIINAITIKAPAAPAARYCFF
jgi:hypothetical protein